MKLRKLLCGVLGLISSILGIVCYCSDKGSYESYVTYGGDAYTGIQNAAAQTANNVQDLAAIVSFGFGSILLIVGLGLVIYALTAKEIDIKTETDSLGTKIVSLTNQVSIIKDEVAKINKSKEEISEEIVVETTVE